MPRAEPSNAVASVVILLLALLGGGAGVLAGRAWLAPAPPASGPGIVGEGELAPDLRLEDLAGAPQNLHAQRAGKPLLINFWATWCPPCVRELPLLARLHDARDGDGLAVLTIAQEDDPAAVQAFLAEHAAELPAWIDPPSRGDASQAFGNRRQVLPYSVLLDAEGRVLRRKAGQLNEDELQAWAQAAR